MKIFLCFNVVLSGEDAPGKRNHERKKQIKTQATRVLATVKDIVRYRCLKCEVQGENIAPRVSYMVRMHISRCDESKFQSTKIAQASAEASGGSFIPQTEKS